MRISTARRASRRRSRHTSRRRSTKLANITIIRHRSKLISNRARIPRSASIRMRRRRCKSKRKSILVGCITCKKLTTRKSSESMRISCIAKSTYKYVYKYTAM